MPDLSELIRNIGENFVSLANELDKQQKATNEDINHIRDELTRNRGILKNIADMINREL